MDSSRRGTCRHRAFVTRRRVLATIGAALTMRSAPLAQPATPARTPTTRVIKLQHLRLQFPKKSSGWPSATPRSWSANLINSREVLVLDHAHRLFTDGTLRDFLFQVQRDLAILEAALKRVHPSIEVESAPDRDALILTGRVPNVVVSETAEAIVRNYLDAGNTRAGWLRVRFSAPLGRLRRPHRRAHRRRRRATHSSRLFRVNRRRRKRAGCKVRCRRRARSSI